MASCKLFNMADTPSSVQDVNTQTSIVLGKGEDVLVDVTQGSLLETVKRSCYGHKGILKRRYKELEALMISPLNYQEVSQRLIQLEKTYKSYVSKYNEYCELLSPESVALESVLKELKLEELNWEEFRGHCNQWMEECKTLQPPSTVSVGPGVGIKETGLVEGAGLRLGNDSQPSAPGRGSNFEVPVGPSVMQDAVVTSLDQNEDASSVASRGSRHSVVSTSSVTRMKEARIKSELARISVAQLQQAQQLDRERLECERKAQLFKVKCESERAEAEAKMWEAEVLAELEDTNRIRQAYIQPKVDLPSVTVSKPKFSTEPWQPNVYAPEWNSDNHQPKSKTTIPDSVPPAGLAEPMVTHNLGSGPDTNASYIFEGMLHSLNMPKPDIITFDGNPSCYWNFMHSFETNVEARVKDDKMRLTYLIQFCKGKARESIEDCVLIRSGSGYKVAKGILAQQFGQNHQVTQALLEKVLEREQIKPNDGKALWDLARQMRKCHITFQELGQTANLNSSDTLLKVQRLLPLYLQSKWAKTAYHLLNGGVQPQFSHMTEYVEQSAQVANNVYGQNIGKGKLKGYEKLPQGQMSRASSKLPHQKGLALSTSTQYESAKRSQVNCLLCNGSHCLSQCGQFKKKSVQDRVNFVRQKVLCINCLLPNHFAKGCMQSANCKVEDCNRKHNTLLHFNKGRSRGPTRSDDGKNVVASGKDSNPTGAGVMDKATGSQSEAKGITSQEVDNGTEAVSAKHRGNSNHAHQRQRGKRVCLRAEPVKVQAHGREVQTWALLDDGSDVSLCEKRLMNMLGLKGRDTTFNLKTVIGCKQEAGREISLTVMDLQGNESVHLPNVWAVDSLPIDKDSLPSIEDTQNWPHLCDIEFPRVEEDGIMLLIGSDVPEAFWVMEERRGRRKEPFAIRSLLGWTHMGPVGPGRGTQMNVHHVRYEDDLLSQQVAQSSGKLILGILFLVNKGGSPRKIAGQEELWRILSE